MHRDIPVNSTYFKDAKKLYVTSIFRTIQSEGPYTGHPAMFIRLAGCNFGAKDSHCRFCDTFFGIEEAKHYTADELLLEMRNQGWRPTDIIVFTGGEPTLQHYLLEVIKKIKANRSTVVQLETNGTQAAFFAAYEGQYAQEFNFFVVCSPKASPKGYMPLSPIVRAYTDVLKFVVSAEEGNHHEIPEWALALSRGTEEWCAVYVSPMAEYLRPYEGEVSSIWDDTLINKEKTAKNYAYAAAYAMKHNLLLSLQGHLFTAIP